MPGETDKQTVWTERAQKAWFSELEQLSKKCVNAMTPPVELMATSKECVESPANWVFKVPQLPKYRYLLCRERKKAHVPRSSSGLGGCVLIYFFRQGGFQKTTTSQSLPSTKDLKAVARGQFKSERGNKQSKTSNDAKPHAKRSSNS